MVLQREKWDDLYRTIGRCTAYSALKTIPFEIHISFSLWQTDTDTIRNLFRYKICYAKC